MTLIRFFDFEGKWYGLVDDEEFSDGKVVAIKNFVVALLRIPVKKQLQLIKQRDAYRGCGAGTEAQSSLQPRQHELKCRYVCSQVHL